MMSGYIAPSIREQGRFADVRNHTKMHRHSPRFSGRLDRLERELAELKTLQAEYKKLNRPLLDLHSEKKISKMDIVKTIPMAAMAYHQENRKWYTSLALGMASIVMSILGGVVVDLSEQPSSSDYQKSFAPLKRLKSLIDPENTVPSEAFAKVLTLMVADGLLIEKNIQDHHEPDVAYKMTDYAQKLLSDGP